MHCCIAPLLPNGVCTLHIGCRASFCMDTYICIQIRRLLFKKILTPHQGPAVMPSIWIMQSKQPLWRPFLQTTWWVHDWRCSNQRSACQKRNELSLLGNLLARTTQLWYLFNISKVPSPPPQPLSVGLRTYILWIQWKRNLLSLDFFPLIEKADAWDQIIEQILWAGALLWLAHEIQLWLGYLNCPSFTSKYIPPESERTAESDSCEIVPIKKCQFSVWAVEPVPWRQSIFKICIRKNIQREAIFRLRSNASVQAGTQAACLEAAGRHGRVTFLEINNLC